MGTLLTTGSYFSLRNPQHIQSQARGNFPDKLSEKVGVSGEEASCFGFINVGEDEKAFRFVGRRTALFSGLCLVSGVVLGFPGYGFAVKQGLLAGRIPGLSDPDQRGWRTYRRPDDKSGGHGVGWSPIIPYSFKVPNGWEEVPVSIADLGGTEIDLRFSNSQEGRLFVIVAPVLRFAG